MSMGIAVERENFKGSEKLCFTLFTSPKSFFPLCASIQTITTKENSVLTEDPLVSDVTYYL